jgi:hypothetical protein
MTQLSRTRSSGNTYPDAIGNEDAGWVEEADQSKSPTGFQSGTDLDNGSEHYLRTHLQEELGMQTYFAVPTAPGNEVPMNPLRD